MSDSTKTVLVLVLIIAIVIPIALSAVLVNGSFALPAKTTITSATNTTSTTGSGPATVTVTLPSGVGNTKQLNFFPAKATIVVGINNTIIWTNMDNAVHNVHFTSVPAGSTVTVDTMSPNLKNGQSYTITLTTPGTYTYVCDYHNWMIGTITVKS